jgi:tRNA(Ile2) C34 agmatinyltransferase TiaS
MARSHCPKCGTTVISTFGPTYYKGRPCTYLSKDTELPLVETPINAPDTPQVFLLKKFTYENT